MDWNVKKHLSRCQCKSSDRTWASVSSLQGPCTVATRPLYSQYKASVVMIQSPCTNIWIAKVVPACQGHPCRPAIFPYPYSPLQRRAVPSAPSASSLANKKFGGAKPRVSRRQTSRKDQGKAVPASCPQPLFADLRAPEAGSVGVEDTNEVGKVAGD